MDTQRYLGVDPGSVVTGFGVVDVKGSQYTWISSGAIRTRSSEDFAHRLLTIYDGLLAVIDRDRPGAFCMETAFFGKNVQSTLKLGHVRGAALLCAMHRNLPVFEYSPREVKRAVTGNGASSKQQVQFMVNVLLNEQRHFGSSDEADAIAIALCHALRNLPARPSRQDWASFIANNPDRVLQK